MRFFHGAVGLGLAVALLAGSAGAAGKESKLPLDQVPPPVLEAAKGEVPGVELREAELEQKPAFRIYELEGVAGGKEYEIRVKVDPQGKIVQVEAEEEEDDDD